MLMCFSLGKKCYALELTVFKRPKACGYFLKLFCKYHVWKFT